MAHGGGNAAAPLPPVNRENNWQVVTENWGSAATAKSLAFARARMKSWAIARRRGVRFLAARASPGVHANLIGALAWRNFSKRARQPTKA